MFAEVFASISSHPSQPVRTRSAYITEITHTKSVSVCLSYSEIAYHLFSIRKTWWPHNLLPSLFTTTNNHAAITSFTAYKKC